MLCWNALKENISVKSNAPSYYPCLNCPNEECSVSPMCQASGQWSDVPQPRVMLLMSRVKGADQQGIGVTGGGGREKVVLISYCFI